MNSKDGSGQKRNFVIPVFVKKMEKKYKKFAEKFDNLCNEFANEDFNAVEVVKICKDIIFNYSE